MIWSLLEYLNYVSKSALLDVGCVCMYMRQRKTAKVEKVGRPGYKTKAELKPGTARIYG